MKDLMATKQSMMIVLWFGGVDYNYNSLISRELWMND